jgi:hypothetical protein
MDALIGFRGLMLQAWSKKHNSFVRPLKKKGFKEERVTTMGLDDIGKSTTLESNKSQFTFHLI